MKYKKGDRIVDLCFRGSGTVQSSEIGINGYVEVQFDNFDYDETNYYHLIYIDEDIVLESVYNSPLYKALA